MEMGIVKRQTPTTSGLAVKRESPIPGTHN
jgi:hypothetical protein